MINLLAPATFSADRRHRYSLCRQVPLGLPFDHQAVSRRIILFCGYNPSTADERENDQTIRTELVFAAAAKASVLLKVNLFGGVSTDPDELATFEDPIGPDNDSTVRAAIAMASLCVAAWGAPKGRQATRRQFTERELLVRSQATWWCLGTTKDGHPRHPLYLSHTITLRRWLLVQ